MNGRRLRPWCERTLEVRSLFNPAFCGRVIYAAVAEYQKKSGSSLPVALVYLVLPLVLTTAIRERIGSRKHLVPWAQENPELLIDFGKRAASFVEITNEAVEFMLQIGYLVLSDNGGLSTGAGRKKLKKKSDDQEIADCIRNAKKVARWFANAGKVETIYICLGVRP